MAEDTSVATPEVGSDVAETTVPETQPNEQSPVEPQTTSIPQVEGDVNKPQTQEPSRPPYDGLFRSERKKIRRLEETIKQLEQKIAQPKEAPKNEPLDHSLLNTDPVKYLTLREQALRDEILALRNEMQAERQSKQAVEQEKRGLEALEKLFPKTSPDSKETLEERINRNPELTERIKEFFEDPAVKAMADKDPEKAVRFAIQELGITPPKPNPLVLKKSAMGGVTTGNPSMGEKRSLSEDDLRSELKKLNEQLDKNPQLRFEEKFQKRKMEILGQISRLVKKNG